MDDQQASASLNSIAQARRMAGELRTYRDARSAIIAWGIVWLAGFSAQQLYPAGAAFVWPVGWVCALGWTVTRPRKAHDWQALATWLIAIGFVALLLLVVRADQRTAAMICALVLAVAYAALGIWSGKRFLILAGTVLVAASLGWWVFPQWLFGSLAVGGGAALILGGHWLGRP